MKLGNLVAGALGCAALALGGCSGLPQCKDQKVAATDPHAFVLVEYRTGQLAGAMPSAEITKTVAYERERQNVKSVVLRLPDNCFRAGSAGLVMQGAAGAGAQTLESNCGLALQVLEAVLSRAGYRVLSWSTLMTIEREQKVAVHEAAQKLQADIVFIVNELTAFDAAVGGEADASYKYFDSSSVGDRRAPKALFDRDRAFLKAFVQSRVGASPEARTTKSRQAKLSLTAVLAQNGEAMWFYNWRIARMRGGRIGQRFLFEGRDEAAGSHKWWPVKPDVPEIPQIQPREVATAEEQFKSKVDVNTTTEDEALYRLIGDDFIRQFKGGT